MKLKKFYADWCGPCKGLTMVINGAKDKIDIPIEEVNIDNEIMESGKALTNYLKLHQIA